MAVAYSLPRDPKDEKYINLAIATDSRYLVSSDNDLLDLMDASTSEGVDFQNRLPSIKILKAGDMLRKPEIRRGERGPN